MREPELYTWETLPEYIAAMQYSRCLGRILRSLPRRVRKRWTEPLTCGAIVMAGGIVVLNADLPPEERPPVEEQERFRGNSLVAIRWSRRALRVLGRARRVDRAQLLAARELLERVEAGVRSADAKPQWL